MLVLVEKKQKHRARNEKRLKAEQKKKIKRNNSREANRINLTEKNIIIYRIIGKDREYKINGS